MSERRREMPTRVQTQADLALERYPELKIEGLEECSRIFALVAQSLGQQPAAAGSSSGVTGHSIGAQTNPEGLNEAERAAAGAAAGQSGGSRREWIRRLGCVFDFEILPSPSTSYIPFLSRRTAGPSAPTKPVHIYLDLLHSGLITLTFPRPPATSAPLGKKAKASPRYKAGQVVRISLTSKDLVRIATGERVPVKLYQNGRLRIKGDVDKALLLGQLLRVTRAQVYHPSTSLEPSHAASAGSQRTSTRSAVAADADELVEEGLQGQGSGSGDVSAGLGGGIVRARL